MESFVNTLLESIKELSLQVPWIITMLFGASLIILESILPILPLALFIAFNVILFGNIFGFILSWISTCIGCIVSYSIFKYGFSKYLYRNLENHPKVKDIVEKVRKLSFSKLVIITAIPFTPAFSINIGAGLSKMNFKKFFFAILISKISIVYFWGFIGTTFLESICDISVLFKLGCILFFTFLLSKIVLKKFDIE